MDILETKDYYADILEREIKYIKSLSFDNGAVGMYLKSVDTRDSVTLPVIDGISPDEYRSWPSARVVPYFADTAVMGVIKACEALGITEGDGKDIVLGYINWHISHMNTAESDVSGIAGTIYDYYIYEGYDGRIVEVPDYDYDSTDSYAAMFLRLMSEYTRAFDPNFLEGKKELVDTLVSVIMSTYVNGVSLTGAKPKYMVCYMMDNCEVYNGLSCAAEIYKTAYNDVEKSDSCKTYAEAVKSSILNRMWDNDANCFVSAVFEDGKIAFESDLSNFYPQATCQLFPILFGVVEPENEKAVIAYEAFVSRFCKVGVPGSDWSSFSIDGVVFPWCSVLRAVVTMGDYEIAQRYVKTILGRCIRSGHKYPYHDSEAGSLMIACAELYALAADEPSEESSEPAEPYEPSAPDVPSQEESFTEPDISEPAVSLPEQSSPVQPAAEKKSVLPWIIAGVGVAVVAGVIALHLFRKEKPDGKKGKND